MDALNASQTLEVSSPAFTPPVTFNEALFNLHDAGVQLNELWEQKAALCAIAATRPLTLSEEVDVDEAETMIAHYVDIFQSGCDRLAAKQEGLVA